MLLLAAIVSFVSISTIFDRVRIPPIFQMLPALNMGHDGVYYALVLMLTTACVALEFSLSVQCVEASSSKKFPFFISKLTWVCTRGRERASAKNRENPDDNQETHENLFGALCFDSF